MTWTTKLKVLFVFSKHLACIIDQNSAWPEPAARQVSDRRFPDPHANTSTTFASRMVTRASIYNYGT